MNRLATTTKRNTDRMPYVAARLNLEDENEQRLHDLIQRMHTGKWPLLKCLAMRNFAGAVVEAAEWTRLEKPTFSLIYWRSDGLGMRWEDAESAEQARALLRAKTAP